MVFAATKERSAQSCISFGWLLRQLFLPERHPTPLLSEQICAIHILFEKRNYNTNTQYSKANYNLCELNIV